MNEISRYLEADHERLDRLLAEATRDPAAIDLERFGAFRRGLLRHIGIEEKLLFAAAKRSSPSPELAAQFARLRADHGKLTALMVPTPTPATVAEIREILAPHNEVEEGEGTYVSCVALLSPAERAEMLAKMEQTAEPPVRPYYDERLPLLLQKK